MWLPQIGAVDWGCHSREAHTRGADLGAGSVGTFRCQHRPGPGRRIVVLLPTQWAAYGPQPVPTLIPAQEHVSHQSGAVLSWEAFVPAFCLPLPLVGDKGVSGQEPIRRGMGAGLEIPGGPWASPLRCLVDLARPESPGRARRFLAGWLWVCVICPASGGSPLIPRAGIRSPLQSSANCGPGADESAEREIKCVGDEKLN